jgi:hypothetical protein
LLKRYEIVIIIDIIIIIAIRSNDKSRDHPLNSGGDPIKDMEFVANAILFLELWRNRRIFHFPVNLLVHFREKGVAVKVCIDSSQKNALTFAPRHGLLIKTGSSDNKQLLKRVIPRQLVQALGQIPEQVVGS